MQTNIHHPDIAFAINPDEMRTRTRPVVAPAEKIASVRSINLHGRIGAGKNPDVVLRVHGDAGHCSPVNLERAPRPVRVHFIRGGEIDAWIGGPANRVLAMGSADG